MPFWCLSSDRLGNDEDSLTPSLAVKAGAKSLCVLASWTQVDMHRRVDTYRNGHPAKSRSIRSDLWAGEVVRPHRQDWTRWKRILERYALTNIVQQRTGYEGNKEARAEERR